MNALTIALPMILLLALWHQQSRQTAAPILLRPLVGQQQQAAIFPLSLFWQQQQAATFPQSSPLVDSTAIRARWMAPRVQEFQTRAYHLSPDRGELSVRWNPSSSRGPESSPQKQHGRKKVLVT